MTRPRDMIAVLEQTDAPPIDLRQEETELLLALIVHIFFSDGVLDDTEVALFRRLVPLDDEPLRELVHDLAERELDFERLAVVFPGPADRQDIVTIAEHAVWGDNEIEPGEMDVIDKLAEVLEITER